jgi:hypothetical protein
MDGTQVFMVKSETEGRAGRTPGQRARTRECKLGAAFTQTTVDEQDRPVRDEHSTTYVGAMESAEEFGLRLYTEAWNRGWDRATIRVVMGDGSHWPSGGSLSIVMGPRRMFVHPVSAKGGRKYWSSPVGETLRIRLRIGPKDKRNEPHITVDKSPSHQQTEAEAMVRESGSHFRTDDAPLVQSCQPPGTISRDIGRFPEA